jgi:hypothetical protein
MRKAIIYTVLFILSIREITFAQEKIYVPNFICEGCNRQMGNSAAFMFADYVNEKGSFEAMLTQKRDTVSDAESYSDTRESAELLSTKFFVVGQMLKLEKLYYIKVSLYATSSGLVFWSSASHTRYIEDVPVMLKEMAFKLATNEKMSQPGDLYLMSRSEGKKINRLHANKRFGFSTGSMLPLNEKEIDHINPGFGGLLSFDLRNFIFETTAEVYFGKDSLHDGNYYDNISNNYYNLGINAIYPLSSTNSAPFVCLGSAFSYRESKVDYYPVWPGMPASEKLYDQGLFVNGGGGYMLKRNSDAALFIYTRGYVFIRDFGAINYGIMVNLSVQLEGW